VTAVEIVVAQEPIEVLLDLGGLLIPGLSPFDAEALVEQRAIHSLDEAIGLRRANPGGAVLDAFERQEQHPLECMACHLCRSRSSLGWHQLLPIRYCCLSAVTVIAIVLSVLLVRYDLGRLRNSNKH